MEGLEQRVEDRTRALVASNANLEQRAAELTTLDGISQALTAELQVDALIELVGEKTRATFDADIVYVALYDRRTQSHPFPL